MATTKTELNWQYSPPDFFEAQYRSQTDDYTLVADGGTVLVTLLTLSDPIDAGLHKRITQDVERVFRLQQVSVHRPFTLNAASVYQHHSDGTKAISVSAQGGEVLCAVGKGDFNIRNASGAIVQDTKAEGIAAHTEFIDSLIPKLARSATLNALLDSYNPAVTGPANELVHLYEIREALAKHYGGDAEARRKLGIRWKGWKRLGYLANDASLKEGRHRGRHSELRHATVDELDEARKIARRLIEAFANQL